MKNYFDLTGQVAVVTGASAGLGLQMAKAFANQGANLVLLARRMNLLEENAKAISEEFGVEVLPVACDITDTEKVKAAVQATIEKFGRVDILGLLSSSLDEVGTCNSIWTVFHTSVVE